jgi:hypothetical protein
VGSLFLRAIVSGGNFAGNRSFTPETSHSRQKQVIHARNKSFAPETSHSRRKQVIRARNRSFPPETSHSRRKQAIHARNKSFAPETSHSRQKQVIRARNRSFAPKTSHSRRKQAIHARNKLSPPSCASVPNWPIYRKPTRFILPQVSNFELKQTGKTGEPIPGRHEPSEMDGATLGENPQPIRSDSKARSEKLRSPLLLPRFVTSRSLNNNIGQTWSRLVLGLTVPRKRVHWSWARRTLKHRGKAVGEDTGSHREEIRTVGRPGIG